MKALTICQPYAELIVSGKKLVENRTWSTTYRGPLLIHAGKSKKYMRGVKELFEANGQQIPNMDFGAIVGECHLVACFHIEQILTGRQPERWSYLSEHIHCEGPFCFVLEEIQRFAKPIPFVGSLGFFDVPFNLLKQE